MIRIFGRALGDLGKGPVLAIMLQALAVTVAIFIVVAGLLVWLFAGFDPCGLVDLGVCAMGAGTSLIGAITLTLMGAWFLFPAVAIAVLTVFGDRVCGAVERVHYPQAAEQAHGIGAAQGLLMGLKSAGRLLAFNLVAAPFYLVLLVTGVGPLLLFVIVNGVALGRDAAELAAARHSDAQSRRAWLKRTRSQQHLIGFVVSVLFLVPFANLLAPVIGAAAAVHLFNSSFWSMSTVR